MNEVNLLKVARALREATDRPFSMQIYHDCGTPQCALGHYAVRHDLQQDFYLSGERRLKSKTGRDKTDCDCASCRAEAALGEDIFGLSYNGSVICEHFGITPSQAHELFSSLGCNSAQTPVEAAEYIEAFVERHREVKEVTPANVVDVERPLVGA